MERQRQREGGREGERESYKSFEKEREGGRERESNSSFTCKFSFENTALVHVPLLKSSWSYTYTFFFPKNVNIQRKCLKKNVNIQRKYLKSACGIVEILGVHSVLSMFADDSSDGLMRANLVCFILFLLPKNEIPGVLFHVLSVLANDAMCSREHTNYIIHTHTHTHTHTPPMVA